MPLILLSGFPCSGKTYRALQLKQYFETQIEKATDSQHKRLTVVHTSDDLLGVSRPVYSTAREEKDARGTLSSAVKRDLRKDVIVICDAMNYIKGFRYQLYCEAKAVQTPNCVIHIGTSADKCREINNSRMHASSEHVESRTEVTDQPTSLEKEEQIEKPTSPLISPTTTISSPEAYEPSLLENLIFRYEEPNGMTRWDSPLFTVPFTDSDPPYDAIWDALIGAPGTRKTIRPNMATVLPASQPADALQQLDRTTNAIVSSILEALKDNPEVGEIKVTGTQASVSLPAMQTVNVGMLQRLRRQFLQLQRSQFGKLGGDGSGLSRDRVAEAFVGFLNGAWGTE